MWISQANTFSFLFDASKIKLTRRVLTNKNMLDKPEPRAIEQN